VEILTKLDRVFESSNSCPGCGSILGLKFLLQSLDRLDNVILVTSPGHISAMGKAGLHVNFVNSRDPASTARGLAKANPELNVIVYAGDGFTNMNLTSLLSANENFIYICYNNLGHTNIGLISKIKELAKIVGYKSAYTATASIAYYEDFINKLKKAFSRTGFRFIDLFAPCPVLLNYDPSNTIEVGRIATETAIWPLFEIDGSLSVTKIPPRIEPVQRYLETLKAIATENEVQALQEYATKNWKALNEGRMI